MFATRASALLASALFVSAALGSVIRADEPAAREAIAKLLDVGWGTTPKVRIAADAQYNEVRRLAGPTPAALEASLLVLLQQRRFDDAAKRSDELLERDPGNLTARRAKIWMAVVLKDYSAAMFATDKLSQQLADDPPRAEDEQAVHDDLHAFLGRIYGYLGGPVAENVNQDERKDQERKIIERITESRRAIFEEARDGVVARFLELTGDKDDERKRVLDEAAAAREKTLKELETEKEAIAGRSKELDGRKDKLQTELRDELAAIAKDDQPLVQELARLDSRARSLNRDLIAYESEISRLQALVAGEKDPNRRFALQMEIDRLSLASSRLESDLFSVRRLADGVQAQRNALLARQRRAQEAAADQAQRIDKELTNLAKRDRVNDAIEKRANKAPSGTTSKTRALSAQATALSTYDQFPLEAARQKLLESLR
jgi:chromosome segregation ATPase